MTPTSLKKQTLEEFDRYLNDRKEVIKDNLTGELYMKVKDSREFIEQVIERTWQAAQRAKNEEIEIGLKPVLENIGYIKGAITNSTVGGAERE